MSTVAQEAQPEAVPFDHLRARGFKSPFGAFGDTVFCPHCGSHYPRARLEVLAASEHGGARYLAVSCPECHAHGLLRGPAEEAS
jgi:hypothetical protein